MQHQFVRKLTQEPRQRRDTVASIKAMLCGLALLALSGVPTGGLAAAITTWHDTADIARTAESHIERHIDDADGRTTVRAGMLDHRLRLAQCGVPLEGFLRSGTRIGPKTIVGVRCNGARPWKVYVPVEMVVRRTVWVARQPLPRGHLLTEADLVADVRDVSQMTSSYVSTQKSLIGQKLKSSILAGRVLTLELVEADKVIRRGQTVTLAVATDAMSIQMAGKAMSDGAMNQRIRVENLNSGRIVEGIVRSRELVEVLVQ